jgi:two-component system phosphate regulon response regulator PhoB
MTAKKHILVIEDERDIAELVRYNLEREGYQVSWAASGEEGFELAKREVPHLILLDLMLPGADGFDICRALRGEIRTRAIPIIIVTAKGQEPDMVAGLEIGADDYITKPFSPRVLVARVKTVLRRGDTVEESRAAVRIGKLIVDPDRFEVSVADEPVELTRTEFKLLHFLSQRPGRVFSREQIIDSVHGTDCAVTDRAIDVQLVSLRKKLGECAAYLETVRGVGYRFKSE